MVQEGRYRGNCGGKVSGIHHIVESYNNGAYKVNIRHFPRFYLVCPSSIFETVVDMITLVYVESNYCTKRRIHFSVFEVDKINNITKKKGVASNLGASNSRYNHIDIFLTKEAVMEISNFVPGKGIEIPFGFLSLISTIWHEIYHMRGERGIDFPDNDTVSDIFFELIDYRIGVVDEEG